MTMIATAQHGMLNLNVPQSGVPALRLLKGHAPDLQVECTDAKGSSILLALMDIDISHEALAKLNAGRASYTPETTGVHAVVLPAVLAR